MIEKKLENKVALMITRVFSPPVLSFLGIFVLLSQTGVAAAVSFLDSAIIASIFFGLPLVYFLFSLKKGWISDWDMIKRRERYRFYLFSLGCWFLGLIYIYNLKNFSLFGIFLMFSLIGLTFTLINFWQKISGHVGTATVFFLIVNIFFGLRFFWVGLIIPLVAWSRVKLERHSLSQVLLGLAVPLVLVPLLAFLLGFR